MSFLIPVANLVVLGWMAYRCWKKESSLQKIFWPALTGKLLAGIAIGLLYTYYYTSGGDTFIFFKDAVILTEWGKNNFRDYFNFLWSGDETFSVWKLLQAPQPRSLFLSKIVSLFNFITGNNYWITSLYFSFISFVCSITLVRSLIRYFPDVKFAAVFSFLCIPSVLFWGSGIVKECLAIASLFFLASVFLRFMKNDRIDLKDCLLTALFIWLLWNVKYYYAAVFLMVTVTAIIVKLLTTFVEIKKAGWNIVLWVAVFGIPLYLLSFFVENFHRENFFTVVVQNYEAYQRLSNPGDAILYADLKPNGWSLLYNAPWALISGIFRPFFWEAKNSLQFMASLENLALFVLLAFSVKKWKDIPGSTDCMLLVSVIIYIVLLCIFLALSTPNFGTLSRYRIGFLPFLFFLVSCHNIVTDRLSTFIQRSFSRLVP